MNSSRRSFFKNGLLAIAALPLIKSQKAFASSVACPQPPLKDAKASKKALDVTSSTAKRLQYVASSDETKNKLHKKGDHCALCNFYQDKKEVENYAPCTMAANRYVASCGWCKSFRRDPKKKA